MTQPPEDLPQDIERLLAQHRQTLDAAVEDFVPDPQMQARVLAKVNASAAAAGVGMATAAKAGLAVLVVAVASLAVARVFMSTPPPRPAPLTVLLPAPLPVLPGPMPMPVPAEKSSPPPGAVEAAARPWQPKKKAAAAAHAPPPAPAEAANLASPAAAPKMAPHDNPAERLLLEKARQQLAEGQADDALVSLDKHRQRFENGTLTEEREALRIIALVGVGRTRWARQQFEVFERQHPNSLLAPALRSTLRAADGSP